MKKIAVISGSRAEYGLLQNFVRELHRDPDFDLQFFVTGSHLTAEFGMTVREVENDEIPIFDKIDVILSSASGVGITKAVGLATIGFADAFNRAKPDLVVVLGDRFEIFGVSQAAAFAGIPMVHIHGGETTEGAFDEFIRHSITKMAQIHFVTAETYRRRVIQLGESPDRVFTVGAPGLDQLRTEKFWTLNELSERIGFGIKSDFLLFTYHPETLGAADPVRALSEALVALEAFPQYQIVMTYPNADSCSQPMIRLLEQYREKYPDRVCLTPSLGRLRYINAMKHCVAVVGNSSSGIIEAPFLKKPTVNIGDRQKGRVMSQSIVNCRADADSIKSAIAKAVSFDANFLNSIESLYGDGRACENMMRILRDLPDLDVRKSFFNLEVHP